MRDLKDYSAGDWLQLRPFIGGFKQLRDDSVQNTFLKTRPPELEPFLRANENLRGKNILQTIAFEQAEVLNFLLKMLARNLVNATVLVFDNSRKPEARVEIERVCRDRGVPYLALPPNRTKHPNRSHGSAMTWIWRNVVTAISPSTAGFLDHDIIPVEKFSPEETLNGQPFYGVPMVSKFGSWSLWAGYCLFDFRAVGNLEFNFLNDFPRGLDTGGRNWNCLYQKYDRHKLKFADWRLYDVIDVEAGVPRLLEIIDGRWVHLAGVSHWDDYKRNSNFFGRINKAIDEGANWEQLRTILGGDKIRLTGAEAIAKTKRYRYQKHSWQPNDA